MKERRKQQQREEEEKKRAAEEEAEREEEEGEEEKIEEKEKEKEEEKEKEKEEAKPIVPKLCPTYSMRLEEGDYAYFNGYFWLAEGRPCKDQPKTDQGYLLTYVGMFA